MNSRIPLPEPLLLSFNKAFNKDLIRIKRNPLPEPLLLSFDKEFNKELGGKSEILYGSSFPLILVRNLIRIQ